MGKDFLKFPVDEEKTMKVMILAGLILTGLLGIKAYKETVIAGGYELQRKDVTEGAYEQELVAMLGEEKIPLTVFVEEKQLSEEEVKAEFQKAEEFLSVFLKGDNENLSCVTAGINFLEEIPNSCVEVQWTEKQLDYFYSDGTLREDVLLTEPVELMISATLFCQGYTKDYQTMITILPRKQNVEKELLDLILQNNSESPESEVLLLPEEIHGQRIAWKKPLDVTFLHFLVLTAVGVVALKIGKKRDERETEIQRIEELERDYAQIVSKFSMLLSAGLSIRNAWERIVMIQKKKGPLENYIYQEMNWGLLQMQKGVSELEVYERFGTRIREVHYKKLMALFLSDKRRGSVPLLDTMKQEMMIAWEERKRKIRQQGEKIGTKLLIPMMGMLGVVFVIVLVPAFLSFQI